LEFINNNHIIRRSPGQNPVWKQTAHHRLSVWCIESEIAYLMIFDAERIIFNQRNTHPKWWFLGFMTVDSNKGFIDYDTYDD